MLDTVILKLQTMDNKLIATIDISDTEPELSELIDAVNDANAALERVQRLSNELEIEVNASIAHGNQTYEYRKHASDDRNEC